MLKEINNKYLKVTMIFAFAIIILLITLFVTNSLSEILENGSKVDTNEDIIYYLNIKYDGVDVKGKKSTDSITSEITSDIITVEDKLPYGLTFKEFIIPQTAVLRSDNQTPCAGSILNNNEEIGWNNDNTIYNNHGITYNKNTNTVSFKVKSLQAGCVLTVGIKTNTPETIDDSTTDIVENRRDFYNFASLKELKTYKKSNNTHLFMGKNEVNKYNVIYEYNDLNLINESSLPPTNSYPVGNKVEVANDIELEGYTFSGWTTNDVEVDNNAFIMPNKDVTFKANFTKNTSYKVTYNIISEDIPNNYVIPLEKTYLTGEEVKLDSLEIGTVIDGYRFLGWDTNITIDSNNKFIMPNNNVIINGQFEKTKYKVEYKFYEDTIPENANNLLPAVKYYEPNELVTLEDLEDIPDGYEFLGWYSENSFYMPNENVVIYGEWKRIVASFSPIITLELNSEKTSFRPNDIINYKITISNPENFKINDVIIKANSKDLEFIPNMNYEKISNDIAKINSINASSSITLYAKYKVKIEDTTKVTNKVELIGAIAENNYQLLDKSYEESLDSTIDPTITLCEEVSGFTVDNHFQFYLSSETKNYDTWISLEKGKCKTLYISPGKYRVKQITQQEYEIKEVKGNIVENNKIFEIKNGDNYEITYVNKFKKKGFLHSFGRTVDKIVGGNE